MIKEFKAPNQIIDSLNYDIKIFLAGSIEMGKAENWQIEIIKLFQKKYELEDELEDSEGINYYHESLAIYNPRRDNWNGSLEQVYENATLNQQINWELTALEWSDVIYFYFDPNTISPISLLELGKFSDKAIVNCPKGYCRKANVDIICERYKIPQVNSHEEFIKQLLK